MLTVKHVTWGGHETIAQVEHVRFYPDGIEGALQMAPALVAYGVPRTFTADGRDPGSDDAIYWSGTCYVMNDQGRTVGRYDLPGPFNKPPIAPAPIQAMFR